MPRLCSVPIFNLAAVQVDGDWKIESTAPPPPAATPSPVPPWESPEHIRAALAQFYPAFERTRTNVETLELPASALSDLRRRGYTPYLDQSRLVAQLGQHKAYAFPAVFRDIPNLCTVISVGGAAGGLNCGAHTDSDTPKPRTSRVSVPGGSVTLAVFSDGVTAAKLETQDGTVETLDLDDGVALVELPDEPKTVSWVDGQGQWSRDVE